VAGRLTRKEVAALTRGAGRHADDPIAWAAYVRKFYARFTDEVIAETAADPALITSYLEAHCVEAIDGGMAAIQRWAEVSGLAAVIHGDQGD